MTDVFKSPLRGCYPLPISPWGIVTYMLLVPAVKIGNPIEEFV
jgi:hypothetical protein